MIVGRLFTLMLVCLLLISVLPDPYMQPGVTVGAPAPLRAEKKLGVIYRENL